jgi:type I restriction enzyme, S subunit
VSFPRYPAYKDSGVEWLGAVPVHWDVAPFKRMVSLQNGSDHKHIECDDGYPVIGSGGPFACASEFIHDGESVLLGRKGTIDKPLYVTGKFWTVDTMYWSKIQPGAFGRFAYYSALTIPFGYYSTNTALPSMTKSVLEAHLLATPPEREQVAIAAFLDRETAKIDALVAEQEQLITLLKEKRQAVISHAVTKGLDPSVPMKDSGVEWLGEVPAHWEVKRIKDCGCEIVDCKNRTPEPHIDGEYFVVRTSCVKDAEFNPEPGYWTNEENFIEWTAKGRPQLGDVLFTREAPTGEACLAPEGLEFCLGQRMMYIRPPKQVLLSEFLLYSIYGGLARERINEKSKGSTVGHLRVGEVGELPLLLPPLDEQQALVKFVAEELSKLHALAAQAEQAIALMTERRSALISAAVTGQIDVRGLAPAQTQAA